MPRSDRGPVPPPTIDWRGWVALAWVVWFGLLYARMVVESRGGKLRAAVSTIATWPEGGPSAARIAERTTPERQEAMTRAAGK